jgi:hypothetical protein
MLTGLAQVCVILVFVVLVGQSAEATESYAAFASSALWALPQIAWCGLFALLGFCLQASRTRHDVRPFVLRRLFGFGPAYALIAMLAVFAIGPAFTSSSIGNYFRDGESWAYLLNLIAIPQATLPGVFEFNVLSDTVNAVVNWAPAVMLLALAITAAPFAGRWQVWSLAAAALAFLLVTIIAWLAGIVPEARDSFVRNLLAGPATGPLLAGLTGALAWHLKARIPIDRRIAAAMAAILAGVALFGRIEWLDTPFVSPALAIGAAYLGLQAAARRRPGEIVAVRLYPLLYPAVCFSFPAQQIVATTAWGSANAAINLVVALLPVLIAAAAYAAVARRVAAVVLPERPATPEPEARPVFSGWWRWVWCSSPC